MQGSQNIESQVIFVPVAAAGFAGPNFGHGIPVMGSPHMTVMPMCTVGSAGMCSTVDQQVPASNDGNCTWMHTGGEAPTVMCGAPMEQATMQQAPLPKDNPAGGCEVFLQGLPKDLASEECLQAVLEQAGFNEEDVRTIKVQPGGKGCVNVMVMFGEAKVATACATHFHGLIWGNMSTPLIANCGSAGGNVNAAAGRKGSMARGKGSHKFAAPGYRGEHSGMWRDGSMRRGTGKAGNYYNSAATGYYGWQSYNGKEEIQQMPEKKAHQSSFGDILVEGSQWEERSTASSSSELSSMSTAAEKMCDSSSDDARSTVLNSKSPSRTSSGYSSLCQSPGSSRMRWADSLSDDEDEA
mmetsp:Transcript_17836/g.41596  ORF Transcript_17836/g.41596 Transcript_17836/m.41596 type:complete len:353 (+) Transcript_17836:120-1178(+)